MAEEMELNTVNGKAADPEKVAMVEEEENSPIPEVALTVPITDDPSQPVWTLRMWVLGFLSCAIISFLNQFFSFRTEILSVNAICAQIVVHPLGKLMAAVLPKNTILNPGPWNMKEHTLTIIFANVGYSGVYAVYIVATIKAYYHGGINFASAFFLCLTTQCLGYAMAGCVKRFVVEPAYMWWPSNLVTVALFRTLHEKEPKTGLSRFAFFSIFALGSFFYYVVPGYLFNTITSLSILCYAFPNSVVMQQISSGYYGMGFLAFCFDWNTITAYLGTPLASPFWAICCVFAGYCGMMFVLVPIFYWANAWGGRLYPFFTSVLYSPTGEPFSATSVLNAGSLTLNQTAYEIYGPIKLTTFFAITYGVGFAGLTSTITHVALWYGKDIYRMTRQSLTDRRPDIHTKLMSVYPDIPMWWWVASLLVFLGLSIMTVEVWNSTLQIRWWGVLFANALAFIWTLPIAIITAISNQEPGLNVITELIFGFIKPGFPIANTCFKTYGYISMYQAVLFLQDFKLGHYMKVPPRAMFAVQLSATVVQVLVSLGIAWYQLTSINNICNVELLPPSSPWTCPSPRVFFNASIIYGLVGPNRVFGNLGEYTQVNWFWLIGAVAPIPFWALYKFTNNRMWEKVNTAVIFNACGILPPATAINFTSWFVVGVVFQFYVYRYHRMWWARYNYVLSAALTTGVAFMAVLLFFALQNNNYTVVWWGNQSDNCPLAACPTTLNNVGSAISATGTQVCPTYNNTGI